MAKFVSAEVVEPLEFDFAPHGPAGVVPEPSTAQMNRFMHDLGEIGAKASKATGQDVDTSDPGAVVRVLSDMNEKDLARQDDAMIDAVARLCGGGKVNGKWQGGEPSRAELAALPGRVLHAFTGWLTAELFRPEAEAAVSPPPLKAVGSGG